MNMGSWSLGINFGVELLHFDRSLATRNRTRVVQNPSIWFRAVLGTCEEGRGACAASRALEGGPINDKGGPCTSATCYARESRLGASPSSIAWPRQ